MKLNSEKLLGKQFNLLTIEEIDDHHWSRKIAFCSCECGGHTSPRLSDVVRGHTRSCGCLNKKRAKKGKSLVHWNSRRRKYEVIYQGKHIGFFYEEALAKQVLLTQENKNV